MKLVLSTLMVVVMLVAIVHAQPQDKDEVAKRQQQFLPPKGQGQKMFYDVEDEDEVAKRQQQFLPPKGQGQKMFYDNQRRGINNGSLASRLLADILQYENSIRNPGAEKV